ncbi:MAG: CRTAC1 family protein [Planctomycetes bacterium]|nr:CRTAC1 family protein [Planctomycetota bacterium]
MSRSDQNQSSVLTPAGDSPSPPPPSRIRSSRALQAALLGGSVLILLLAAAAIYHRSAARREFSPQAARPALPPEREQGFVDVTRAAGVEFLHSFGDGRFSNLVEAVGGGAAWLDFDQDGLLDLYLATGKYCPAVSKGEPARGNPLNRLFRNRGDGTFEEATERAGAGCAGSYSMGVAACDYDNDGYPDLYVCNFGPNILLRNRRDGTFEDATARAGVGDPRCSAAAAWLDYDRDGLNDLYVANYIRFDPNYNLYYAPDGFPGPLAYAAEPDRLYRNRGDGTFEDVTGKMGITGAGRAMSASAADLNGDDFDDLYVSNDAMENFLYLNEGGARFREQALTSGVAYNSAGDSTSHMGADFGDYDGDGRLDIFVSDSSISSLFHNDGGGRFTDVSVAAGVGRQSAQFVGWGAFFFDFDNDGDLDIFKVNADLSRLFGQEPQIFENSGGGRFRDASEGLGEFFQKEWMARGAACGDYDNDGDLDAILVNLNSPAVLLRNDGGRNSWIEILLRGGRGRTPGGGLKGSNRDGLGAKVSVTAGGRVQVAERRSSAGYLSQNDPRLHFGLGQAESVEKIEIRWPSGKTQVLAAVPARKILVVEEPDD